MAILDFANRNLKVWLGQHICQIWCFWKNLNQKSLTAPTKWHCQSWLGCGSVFVCSCGTSWRLFPCLSHTLLHPVLMFSLRLCANLSIALFYVCEVDFVIEVVTIIYIVVGEMERWGVVDKRGVFFCTHDLKSSIY